MSRREDELSQVDTGEGARRWLAARLDGSIPPLLIVIGPGRGPLLDAIESLAPTSRVLALEPDRDAGRAAWARSASRAPERLLYLVGPDYDGAENAWRLFPAEPADFKLLVNPAVAANGGDGAIQAAKVVKRIVFEAQANAQARRQFAPRYLANTLRNAPSLARGRDVRGLANAYCNTPAVIAAAGPSLDESVVELREASSRGLLIACDTALRPLLAHSVHPHLVVGVDPGERNARHFQALTDCPDTWLVAESAIDPGIADRFDTRTFWFRVADHEPWPWYRELGLDVGQIEVWGSVLTAAFQVAILAGCDPIVLVGADFAWKDGRPYGRGTTYEFDWAYSTAIGSTLEEAWQQVASRKITAASSHGREAVTTEALQAFRDWIVRHAARSARRIINTSSGGLCEGGEIEQAALTETLTECRSVQPPGSLPGLATTTLTTHALADAFTSLLSQTSGTGPSRLDQWTAFTGDGLPPAEIAAALEDAVNKLEHEHGTSKTSEKGWIHLVGQTTPPLITHLPEVIGRLRLALEGVRPLPAPPAKDSGDSRTRIADLEDALELLDPICSALAAHREEYQAPLDRWTRPPAPVSGLCAWPSEIAWPLQVFEGLLGRSYEEPWPSQDSFFSRAVTPSNPREPHGAFSNEARPSTGPAAQLLLALEWVACRLPPSRWPDAAAKRIQALRAVAEAGVTSTESGAEGPDRMDIRLTTTLEGRNPAFTLTVPSDARRLARALTGLVVTSADDVASSVSGSSKGGSPGCRGVPLTRLSDDGCAVTVGVTLARRVSGTEDRSISDPILLTPRVLTDEGVERSRIAYATSGGVVCAGIHRHESVIVREDGSTAPYQRWPRPIIGELPLGRDGSVAWNNGTAGWPEVTPGYVMYRPRPDADAVVEDLPFGPTFGVGWRERVFWTCYPSGVGSWAPGARARLDLQGEPFRAISSDGTRLQLEPCPRGPDGQVLRQPAAQTWRWRPEHPVEPIAAGELGVASCRISDSWGTVWAHPEADAIVYASTEGRTCMLTCYYPLSVAWLGRSLLAATVDGEVLLFEGFRDTIDTLLAPS